MAISSSSTSTTKSGGTLDVAGIVSSLMEVENVPVTKIDGKIASSTVKVSALGQIKGSLSALSTALNELQSPSNFFNSSASFSDITIADATVSSTASLGTYQFSVKTLAQTSITNLSGFGSELDANNWYKDHATVRSESNATVYKADSGKYVLSLTSKSSGIAARFTSAFQDQVSTWIESGKPLQTVDALQEATDAEFKINGITFKRSSNVISDALSGVTINLRATINSNISLTIAQNAVSPKSKLNALVKAYNDLLTVYKEQTASSTDPAKRGVLNSDLGVTNMMRQVQAGMTSAITNSNGQTLSGQSDLSTLGLKLQDDGSIAFDDTLFNSASLTLQTRLISGIRIGFNSLASSDLKTQIQDMLVSGGVIADHIESEKKYPKRFDN